MLAGAQGNRFCKEIVLIDHTFCHIQGIGAATEKRLWEADIHQWTDFVNCPEAPLSAGRYQAALMEIEQSLEAFGSKDIAYFFQRLPAREHWRLFGAFRGRTAYLDIETTGLDFRHAMITTIALYDGTGIFTYVHGENLDRFVEDIFRYDLIITYNGKTFDVPFMESFFGVEFPHAHIDLRWVLGALGYKGGLKAVEKRFGLSRAELEGVDGYLAVLLWNEYAASGNRAARETLIAYNIEDVINLEFLMHSAYNLKVEGTPFGSALYLDVPTRPAVPYSADPVLVERIRSRYSGSRTFW